MVSNSPIIPAVLFPTHPLMTVERNHSATRSFLETGGARTIVAQTMFLATFLRSDGKLLIATQKDIDDTNTPGTYLQSSPIYQQITKATAGDFVPDYSGYKNSYTNPGSVDQKETVVTAYTYPADLDGRNEALVGGYFMDINTSYPIDSSYSEQQIKVAFDSI